MHRETCQFIGDGLGGEPGAGDVVAVTKLADTRTGDTLAPDGTPVTAVLPRLPKPVYGVAIAAAILGESVGPRDLIGVSIIMAGILAVQTARMRSPGPARP